MSEIDQKEIREILREMIVDGYTLEKKSLKEYDSVVTDPLIPDYRIKIQFDDEKSKCYYQAIKIERRIEEEPIDRIEPFEPIKSSRIQKRKSKDGRPHGLENRIKNISDKDLRELISW